MLTKAATTGTATTIARRLSSTPDQPFVLRFFANRPGGDEGETFIGQRSFTTDGDGNGRFTFAPERRVEMGKTITATATDARGNTSEFSPPRPVEPGTTGR